MIRTNFNFQNEIITMVRGDTVSFAVSIEDQFGNPLDVETAYLTCRKNFTDAEPIFEKHIGRGIERASEGVYLVRIAPSDTKDVEIGQYFYDLQVGLNTDVFTILKGVIDIEWDVTGRS